MFEWNFKYIQIFVSCTFCLAFIASGQRNKSTKKQVGKKQKRSADPPTTHKPFAQCVSVRVEK